MGKVIQVRDVPDRVHAALVEAEARGLSLTSYLQRELTQLADKTAVIQHILDVIHACREQVQVELDRHTILDAIEEGRAERWP